VAWEAVESIPPLWGYAVSVYDGCTLKYYNPRTAALSTDAVGLKPIPASVTEIRLGGLHAGLRYVCAFAACNELGWSAYSPFSEPAVVEAPPPPKILAAGVVGSRSIRLSWQAPDLGGAPEVTGYGLSIAVSRTCLLYYDWESGSLRSGAGEARPIPADRCELVVHGLSASEKYRLRLAAKNSVGWGKYSPFSEPVTIAAPSAPERPAVHLLNQTSLQVTWSRIEHKPRVTGMSLLVHVDGKMKYFDARTGTLKDKGDTLQPAPAAGNFAYVGGLSPGKQYRVSIAAVNEIGWSN